MLHLGLWVILAAQAFAQVPVITAPPLSRIAVVGQAVSFTVGATSAEPLSYQWKRNGQVIAGAANATLALPGATYADGGWYQVVVSNASGTTKSVYMLSVAPNHGVVVSWPNLLDRPAGLENVAALAKGLSHSVALRMDGTVVGWGDNSLGATTVPAGLGDVVAVAAGDSDSVALKGDGTVVAWGRSTDGQIAVPAGLNNVVAIAAGGYHVLALKADGTVVAWGKNFMGTTVVPKDLNDVVGVAAGQAHSLVLRADGTVIAWGNDATNVTAVPAGLNGVVAIGAGSFQSFALKLDGTLVGWGHSSGATVPAGLGPVMAVASGSYHTVALKPDGSVVSWGDNGGGAAISVPAGLANVVSIAAGGNSDLALTPLERPSITTEPVGQTVAVGQPATFSVVARGTIPLAFQWTKNGVNLADGGNISGATGATLTVDIVTSADAGTYQVTVTNAGGSVTSETVTLTVATPPTITARPLSQFATVGQAASFSVAASDPGAMSYQWRHNGQAIAGATGATLDLASVNWSDRGYYEVTVSNGVVASTTLFYLGVQSAASASLALYAWGATSPGMPPDIGNIVAAAAGESQTVALRADGTVAAWGGTIFGEGGVPGGLQDVVAISANRFRTIALKANGTPVIFGRNTVPAGMGRIVGIAAGYYPDVYLKADGTVYVAGPNLYGENSVPTGLSGVVAVAAGRAHCLALRSDGTVVAWGRNESGQATVPVGLHGVVAIAAGLDHSLALKADGTVVGWGLAGGATVPAGLSEVVAIAAGSNHSLALRADGKVIGWGQSGQGQTPVPDGLAGVMAIAAGGDKSIALAPARAAAIITLPASQTGNIGGSVTFSVVATGFPLPTYQWRKNGVALTDGGTVSGSSSPRLTLAGVQAGDAGNYSVLVSSGSSSVESTSAGLATAVPPTISGRPASRLVLLGQSTSLAVAASDATPLTFQWRHNGRVIAGVTGATLTVSNVTPGDAGVYEVIATNAAGGTAGAVCSLIVPAAETTVAAWGGNDYHQLDVPYGLRDVAALAGAAAHSMALKSDGSVVAWGTGTYGQTVIPAAAATNNVAVAAGGGHSVVLKADGTVVIWGNDWSTTPAIPAGLRDVAAIATGEGHTLALKSDGTVVAWGENSDGQATVPAGLMPVTAVAAGAWHGLALTRDGTVVAWGRNTSGQRNVPTQLAGVTAIAAGYYHSLALKADGTVVAWGDNTYGQASVPFDLANVVAIAAGGNFSAVLKADGSTVIWGAGVSGAPEYAAGASALVAGRDHVMAIVPIRIPVIGTQPETQISEVGGSAVFAATATGTPPLSYQWYHDGIPIAQGPILTLSDLQLADAGSYRVRVNNAFGAVTSSTVVLRGVNPVPTITTAPQAPVTTVGETVGLTVTASGTGALSYEWRCNGTPIPGATGTSLNLGPATLGQNGLSYDVVIRDGLSVTVSPPVALRVTPASYPRVVSADPAFTSSFDAVGGTIRKFVRLADGRIYIAGLFSRLGGVRAWNLARLTAAGAIDPTFSAALSDGTVQTLDVQSDGKLVIGGTFTRIAGKSRGGLARLNGDGSLDDAFVPDFNYQAVEAIRVQPDGRILVGAGATSGLVRVNSDGSRDATFYNSSLSGFVYDLALQPDGKIVAGGSFSGPGGLILNRLARLNADGSLDTSFYPGTGPNFTVTNVRILSDGRVLAAGYFRSFNGSTIGGIVRLTAAGAIDPAWSSGSGFTTLSADSGVDALELQPDGKILTGGAFTHYAGTYRPLLARLTADGALDTSFVPPALSSNVSAVTRLADGTVIIGGAFTGNINLLNNAGAAQPTPLSGSVFSPRPAIVLPLPGGKVIAAGTFSHVNGVAHQYLARISADGSLDPTFNTAGIGPSSEVNSLMVQPDGRLVIAGNFATYNGTARPYLARINTDGTLDASFQPDTSGYYYQNYVRLFPLSGGRMLVYRLNSSLQPNFVRLKADGSPEVSFPAPESLLLSSSVSAVAEQADGRLMLAGSFTNYGGSGSAVNRIARVLPSGVLDASFTSSVDATVNTVALQSDGKILVGGDFLSINGAPCPRIARLNADGTLDTAFHPGFGPNRSVRKIHLQADGRILVTGWFTSVNGAANTAFIARLQADGAVDTSFAAVGINGGPSTFEMQDDGALLLSGGYGENGAVQQYGVLRTISTAGPVVLAHPQPATLLAGNPLALSAAVAGGENVTYQWLKNGSPVAGANGTSFTLTSAQAADSGSYALRVIAGGDTVTTNGAVVTVSPSAPVLASNFAGGFGGAIALGSRWPLTAPPLVGGSGPLTYQWFRNGAAIPGATARTYLRNWQPGDAGAYYVTVTNSLGSVQSKTLSQLVTGARDWTWSHPSPQGNALCAATFLNGRFLVGGVRGTILTSTDGQSWSVQRLGISESMSGFACGNGAYVALSSFGGLWFSSDATTWVRRDSGVGADGRYLTAVAYGGGRFVAVGDGGVAAYSTDGVAWTASEVGAPDDLQGVAYGGGRFVSFGGGGRTYVSADGVAWSGGTTLPREISAIAFGAGRFVAGGGGAGFTSTDGVAWSERNVFPAGSVRTLQYSGNIFLALIADTTTAGRLATSSDGLSWTDRQFVTVNNGSVVNPEALTFGANRYVVVSRAPDVMFTSGDGLSWNREGVGSAVVMAFTSIAASNSELMVAGFKDYGGRTWTSTNGTQWTVSDTNVDYGLNGVAYGGGRFVAVGGGGEIKVKPDGGSWSYAGSGTTRSLYGVSYVNSRFVAVGAGGTLLSSTDGSTWSASSTGVTQSLYKVAYGANTYVAVGTNGTVLSSPDLVTWTARNPNGIASNIDSVIFAGDKFVLVSEGGSIRTSGDGIAWTARTNPLEAGLRSLTYANGTIYAFILGNTDYLTSVDGITWSPAQHGSANANLEAAFFGGKLHLVGDNTSIVSLPVSVPLPTITSQPAAQTVAATGGATFTVIATGTGPFTYQWFKDGFPLIGANGSSLALSHVSSADGGSYSVAVTNAAGSVVSATAVLTVEPLPEHGLVAAAALTDAHARAAPYATFTVEGTTPKQMLIRAVGPTLAGFGVTDFMADPRLSILDLQLNETAANDDWSSAANAAQIAIASAQVGAYPLPNGSKDAAVLATFAPGTYQARMLGLAQPTTGTVSFEIYEVDSTPRLVYLAVRGRVGVSSAFAAGFSVVAPTPGRSYLVRALGPALGSLDALADPQLALFSGSTQLAENDNWGGDGALAGLAASAGAMALPSGSKDAAIHFAPTSAGTFTAQVRGAAGTTGTVLIEIVEVDPQRTATAPLALISLPESLTINAGQPASFGVVATGKPQPSYLWSKNFSTISGATGSTLSIPTAQTTDAGTYSVTVYNGTPPLLGYTVQLIVNPANNATQTVAGNSYIAGGTVTVTNTLYYVGVPASLGWSVALPSGWSYASDGGSAGDVKPAMGATGTLAWTWTSPPASPVTFTYTLHVPSDVTGDQTLAAVAAVDTGSTTQFSPQPGLLIVRRVQWHSADTDHDGRLGLQELLRVIELYNTRNGTVRTGSYAVDAANLEDGFATDAARLSSAVVALAKYHSADSDHDGKLSLAELLRVIELYNTRSGSVRTGQYHVQAGTEDGFAAGP